MQYRRILVLGCPGSGKTTFALKLGTLLRLPVVHLDKIFWNPGWVAKSAYEFRARLEEVLAGDAWIIDGNYSNTLSMRLERCQLVIYFDMPRRVSLFGVLKRALKNRGKTRSDMGDGCPERLDWEFIKYTWNFKRDKADRNKFIVTSSGKPVVWLRSRRDAKRYLKEPQITQDVKSRV
jgi:adenylate kinase family enzyme